MARDESSLDFGVNEVAERLNERLRRFIESQYHVRDESVIEERHALLLETGAIGQQPYVETTPTYELGSPYDQLGLPSPIGETLSSLASWDPGIGVFPRPYAHQAEALQAYFNDGCDLIVSTGTGSGKTETFLLPILGELLREASERNRSYQRPGCRALLLYPMNSLVSDQMSRLRRLFGDYRLADLFRQRYGRHPLFGMYTSRTPYPGPRNDGRDRDDLLALLQYYLDLDESSSDGSRREGTERVRSELQARGRWPSKDLRAFAGRSGARMRDRFHTQPGDRELLTRHEMQARCPDILVTNFSMLEYMLLRPIERSIFDQTREWLAKDSGNSLVLVLDEAHMYRGSGGAEVGLLIRRLQARLGVGRDRLRCVLTSASLGDQLSSEGGIRSFAAAMTGRPRQAETSYRLVRGRREARPAARPASKEEASALANLGLAAFQRRGEDFGGAEAAVSALLLKFGWPAIPEGTAAASPEARHRRLREHLYGQLSGFGPIELLIAKTTGNAIDLSGLASSIFPAVDAVTAHHALDSLLALGTYAHNGDRPLLSTRVHLFFRGLPSLYACVNPNCEERRHRPGDSLLLGRLYTEPRTHCTCSQRARVYELYSHRDCGAVFLRVFGNGSDADFYWHEQGGRVSPDEQPLDETWLLIEKPHPKQVGNVQPVWLELSTGRCETRQPADVARYRLLYRPTAAEAVSGAGSRKSISQGSDKASARTRNATPFSACPACTKRNAGHWITSLATRGDQPFANLVREQLVSEPLERETSEEHPNGGRKVLLFSDGRQKAARLARDLPREVEVTSFRETLLVAAHRLIQLRGEAKLDKQLYAAFVAVCHEFHLHLFDREPTSQAKLLEDIRRFDAVYGADLEEALDDWSYPPPRAYQTALLRQLCAPLGSLYQGCIAVVHPSKASLRKLKRALPGLNQAFVDQHLGALADAWVQAMLDRTLLDPSLQTHERLEIDEFFKPLSNEQSQALVADLIAKAGSPRQVTTEQLNEKLLQTLTADLCLVPETLALEPAVDTEWFQCGECGIVQHQRLSGHCANCGGSRPDSRSPEHPYMRSRKDYFREPIRAVLKGAAPIHITTEEHTAQLSHRDSRVAYATTEEFELRFQDVPLYDLGRTDRLKPPVDVLSCTTTMEVGIDIGSLNAIGLRNVPPQRENYQQRAGRAGRRGSAVSTVVTYAQDGPHDGYYYSHPSEIISGRPREPHVRMDNVRLARRHIHSFLIQTFFHDSLQRSGAIGGDAAAKDLMSALGTAKSFFGSAGEFSLPRFRDWVDRDVIAGDDPVARQIVAWLPDELRRNPGATSQSNHLALLEFGKQTSREFVAELERLAPRYAQGREPERDERSAIGNGDEGALFLNSLFDSGLLPSYAFPTDLCTFYVFDPESGRVKEQPEQSKDKALSEYAPGRLLVVNKETYRVGGIFVAGASRHRPFQREPDAYVHCQRCSYVRLEPLGDASERCPICGGPLEARETLDPSGFSPEGGKPLRERDRDQDFSYATTAQFPLPVRPDEFEWRLDSGMNLRYAFQENRRLVIVNKGPNERGFRVCESCGAAWPEASGHGSSDGHNRGAGRNGHLRPYVIGPSLRRSGTGESCTGPLHDPAIYLGHSFLTDLLVLRLALHPPMDYRPQSPWLHDALRTLAEAVSLAAGLELDVDPGEISAGYRMVPAARGPESGILGSADIYLYDSASGGAGYAAEAGAVLRAVLDRARGLLLNCPAHCERSCTRCLRHYGNRYWHERLDRHLGAQLLDYVVSGAVPSVISTEEQAQLLGPLRRYLDLEGSVTQKCARFGGVDVPIVVSSRQAAHGSISGTLAIGTYPSLLDRNATGFDHPLLRLEGRGDITVALLNDYVVTRDLPVAYQQCVRS